MGGGSGAYRSLLAEFSSALLASFGNIKNLSDKQLCVQRCRGAEAKPQWLKCISAHFAECLQRLCVERAELVIAA